MNFRLLHLSQHVADGACLGYIEYVLDDVRKAAVHAAHQLEEALAGDHANDVVHVFFINRKTGKGTVQHDFLNFLDVCMNGKCGYFDTWNENFTNGSFIKLQGGKNQIALLLFQDAFFFNFINDIFEFILRHTGCFGMRLADFGKMVKQQDKRCHSNGECRQCCGKSQGTGFCMGFCIGLRQNFAEG